MAKRDKSNLIRIPDQQCAYDNCIFKEGYVCTHPKPIIYHGLGGLCRSFKPKDEQPEEIQNES